MSVEVTQVRLTGPVTTMFARGAARVLSVVPEGDDLVAFVEQEIGGIDRELRIACTMTGVPIPSLARRFVQTVRLGEIYWHVYQIGA